MSSLADVLRKNKPQLSASSIKTYVSLINMIYNKLENSGSPTAEYFQQNWKKVIDNLQDVNYQRRKTILAGLIALCGSNAACSTSYRQLMMKDIHQYTSEEKKQEMSPRQKENWITQDEVKERWRELQNDTKHLLKKQTLTSPEKQRLMDFVILSLYVMIEPRRILDYISFKTKNINPGEDNYMKGLTFIFQRYKTAKTYGKQVIKIPIGLNRLIRRWTELSGNDHLLFSDRNLPLNQSQLTTRLNKIFHGRNISVNILRSSYLSELYSQIPKLQELEQHATNMAHSFETALHDYVKPEAKN
jgi:hypothetical protein